MEVEKELIKNGLIVSRKKEFSETIEKGIINQALMRMRVTSLLHISYFLIYFEHILKEESAKSGKGTAIKNIPPFDILKKMLVPLPSINEINKIISKLGAVSEPIASLMPYKAHSFAFDTSIIKILKLSSFKEL